MSKLRLANGDDHAEAARKHLDDASALNHAVRADGTAYLSGYVVECSLKSLFLLEQGVASAALRLPWKKGRDGHDVKELAAQASTMASVAGARTARYLTSAVSGLAAMPIAAWDPEMRYRAAAMTSADADSWLRCAETVYQQTVGQMLLDGVL